VADLLLDTDVFIDHLRGARRLKTVGDRISYSVVTRCELFAGGGAHDELIRLLLAPFTEVPVDRSIAERAGQIKRATGIRTPDALIAATALELGCALVTRNMRDFRNVKRLRTKPPS
jgi:predicted nucleic acid-binding protein